MMAGEPPRDGPAGRAPGRLPGRGPLASPWLARGILALGLGFTAAIGAGAATGMLPGVTPAHLQLLLLAAVLLVAVTGGLAAGLVAATGGFGLLLWAAVEPTGGGWALGWPAVVDGFLWFAVAKVAVALVAGPRGLLARQTLARQRAEETARQRLLLLTELSHRTMNDMQRLAGMLRGQAAGAADPETAAALRMAAGRMQVLRRVHERLLPQGAEAARHGVDTRSFIEGLVADLHELAGGGAGDGVTLLAEAEAHELPPAVASNIGLALNELITNAVKHGFPDGREGVVRVAFRRDGELYELTVSDNGVGPGASIATGEDPARRGLGSRLLRALASQLGGRFSVEAGEVGGTRCRIRFPVAAPADAAPAEADEPPAEAVPERRQEPPASAAG